MVGMSLDCRDDPDMDFDVLSRQADEQYTVEVANTFRACLKKRPTAHANERSVNRGEQGVDGNMSTPAPAKVCWGYDTSVHARCNWPHRTKKTCKKDQRAQPSTGAFSETSGQPVVTQLRTQPAGTSVHGKTVVQGQAMGARAVVGGSDIVSGDIRGNATRCAESFPQSRYCQWGWAVMPKQMITCLPGRGCYCYMAWDEILSH